MQVIEQYNTEAAEASLKHAVSAIPGVCAVFSGNDRGRKVTLRKDLFCSFTFGGCKLNFHDVVCSPSDAVHLSKVTDASLWLESHRKLLVRAEDAWKTKSQAAISQLFAFYEALAVESSVVAGRIAHNIVTSVTDGPRQVDWLIKTLPKWQDRARTLIQDEIEASVIGAALHDVRLASYKDFFTDARNLGKRKLTLFVGPTNSGKTYHALNEMARHESGVYLAPLRLLALEGQEELSKRGRPTSFLTGEERDIVPGARFTASTIEMLNLYKTVDCALIDEVQNLADSHRGWAWTQALVGVPARQVLMTGSLDCVELVKELAEYLGEELEILRLERKTPLRALEQAVRLSDPLEPGTAIIAFSRRDVLGIREVLEERKIATSVIYGALSPEVRRNEANRFRKGETSVLISTDALGQGLNLAIRIALFFTLSKWDGKEHTKLSHRDFLQIAGRAGRFGLAEEGYVGAVHQHDCDAVKQMLHGTPDMLSMNFGVQPAVDHLAAIKEIFSDWPLKRLLLAFVNRMRFDFQKLQPSVTEEMYVLAGVVDLAQMKYQRDRKDPMSLKEAFLFACAPVDIRANRVFTDFQKAIEQFCKGQVYPCPRPYRLLLEISRKVLEDLEEEVKSLTLYCWLAFRFPDTFPDLELAEQYRAQANEHITQCLRARGLRRTCQSCNKLIDPLSRYSRCDRCYVADY
jgi:ATP-dependent RNA helicase SUPV3L1/SUV3